MNAMFGIEPLCRPFRAGLLAAWVPRAPLRFALGYDLSGRWPGDSRKKNLAEERRADVPNVAPCLTVSTIEIQPIEHSLGRSPRIPASNERALKGRQIRSNDSITRHDSHGLHEY